MNELEALKREVASIKERNARVERDKAWETSLFRKVLVALLTYIVIVIFFVSADLERPFASAIVPTLGFLLSTLSIPVFKKLWDKNFYSK